MRVFPAPYRGLHPAYPETPLPLPDNGPFLAPAIAGFLGLPFLALTPLFKSRTKIGFTVAAYSGLCLTIWSALLEVSIRRTANVFLESKATPVPKAKFFERTTCYTFDDFIIGGAAAGVFVASIRRSKHVLKTFPRVGGAACFGSSGGMLTALLYTNSSEMGDALDEFARRKEIAGQYREEVKQATKDWISGSRTQHQGLPDPAALNGAQISPREATRRERASGHITDNPVLQGLAERLAQLEETPTISPRQTAIHPGKSSAGVPTSTSSGGGEKRWSPLLDDPDLEDPQPHLSRVSEDGERIFIPMTNYNWTPKATDPEGLTRHGKVLRDRRQSSSREAELLWNQIAVREAQLFDTPQDDPTRADIHAQLDHLNNVHTMLWGHVMTYQWMLSNCEKIRLQLEAKENGSQWIPPLPTNSGSIVPILTLEALEQIHDNVADSMEKLKVLNDLVNDTVTNAPYATEPYIDPRTGEPAKDAVALSVEMLQMSQQELRKEILKDKAIQELVVEWQKRNSER